jgi:SulP family sulfate permease
MGVRIPSLREIWKGESKSLLPDLVGGTIAGSIAVVFAISYSALIFSGPLAGYVNRGAGLFLAGTILMLIIVALTSTYPAMIATFQDSAAAILALMSVGIVQGMSGGFNGESAFLTVAVGVMSTTLLMGIAFVLLGWLRLGNLIRFIPYPVIGGFMASTGWLLFQGGFNIMAGEIRTPSDFNNLMQPAMLIQWIPGIAFAVILLVISRRAKSPWILPGTILFSLVAFSIWIWISPSNLEKAVSLGLTLNQFNSNKLFSPILPGDFKGIDWILILKQADEIGSVMIISVISLLLNASSIELATKSELDLNNELKTAGMGNLASGLAGGLVGYHVLSDTLLLYKIGAKSRLAPLVAAAICSLGLFLGANLIMTFPKALLGGLVCFLGLTFLVEWLYDAFSELGRADYAIILVILFTAGMVGFLQGIAVGVLIAVLLFVINYSRTEVVRAVLSGANFMSAVDRPLWQRKLLKEVGSQVVVFQLQGFIFFGTAFSLLTKVRERVESQELPKARFLILNFSRVSGQDSSASSSFLKMAHVAEKLGSHLVMVGLSDEMVQQLIKSGFCEIEDAHLHFFPSLDEALEWCENKLLAELEGAGSIPTDFAGVLSRAFPNAKEAARFMAYFEVVQVPEGERLIEQGDESDALYLVDSGNAEVLLRLPDGHEIRLRTIQAGALFGEVGIYLGEKRSASIVTTCESRLYRLKAEAIKAMEKKDPELAAGLHKWMAGQLAERLAQSNLTLAALMD